MWHSSLIEGKTLATTAKEEIFDHPPTAKELEEAFLQNERCDPRSLLYERTLVRPKIPVMGIMLFVLLTVGACMGTYMGTLYVFPSNQALAVISTMGMLCVIGCLFAKRILITLVKLYQALAPKKVRSRCRYEPSCSVYMVQVLEKYGVRRGLKKGLKRWRSCAPPNGGIDLP